MYVCQGVDTLISGENFSVAIISCRADSFKTTEYAATILAAI
jgi:hypothetical protein